LACGHAANNNQLEDKSKTQTSVGAKIPKCMLPSFWANTHPANTVPQPYFYIRLFPNKLACFLFYFVSVAQKSDRINTALNYQTQTNFAAFGFQNQ
jgi:hypothetical protein